MCALLEKRNVWSSARHSSDDRPKCCNIGNDAINDVADAHKLPCAIKTSWNLCIHQAQCWQRRFSFALLWSGPTFSQMSWSSNFNFMLQMSTVLSMFVRSSKVTDSCNVSQCCFPVCRWHYFTIVSSETTSHKLVMSRMPVALHWLSMS